MVVFSCSKIKTVNKILHFLFLFAFIPLYFGQWGSVEKRFMKKMEDFKKEDFPKIKFNTPDLLEGIYETRKDLPLSNQKLNTKNCR